ncbi:MAG: CvpA family protein [Candidatus Krumholzibacteria bacterium]|nr:CvpA family protein [Candidatus Krumholzibacteria bacterium]MDH4337674.1 CvpA family protein [Candidatus Krumholzibacteria bacterium]MDH5270246.1 CvpA family protein [Candidatus Krumholzibacteria bacterium]
MSDVTVVNVVLLGMLAIGMITGAIKGFTRQVIELVGLVVSFFVAAVIASWLASQIAEFTSIPHTPSLVIAFIAVFVGGMVAFHFVAISAQRMMHMTLLGIIDRFAGAALGLVAAVLVTSVVTTVLLELPIPDDLRSGLEDSSVCAFVQPVAGWLFEAVFPQESGHIAAGIAMRAAASPV